MYSQYIPKGLVNKVKSLYRSTNSQGELFHSWSHIDFVARFATEFSEHCSASTPLVSTAALVHDLNYFVDPKSPPEAGSEMRFELLSEFDFENGDLIAIEEMIIEAHTAYRTNKISKNAMCLSDADTLFKALPITPVINARRYCLETGETLKGLTQKILSEQQPLFNQGIYFYTELANEKYLKWAKTNLELWNNIDEWFRSDCFVEEYSKFD